MVVFDGPSVYLYIHISQDVSQ